MVAPTGPGAGRADDINDSGQAVGTQGNSSVIFSVSSGTTISSVGPTTIWLGLKNSDSVGAKFDLRAELLKNGVVIAQGQLDGVPGGSSGFNNAVARVINFGLLSTAVFDQGDSLGLRLSVRIAANVPGHNSATARVWYGDQAANSRLDALVNGVARTFYLTDGFALTANPGAGPRRAADVFVARTDGNPFRPFGTWSIVF
jgi:hypothetical protein